MKHTIEPWQFGHFGTEAFWIGPNETRVSVAFVPHDCDSARDESRENARRIVACVNACAGISNPDDYEFSRVLTLADEQRATCLKYEQQRDELLEALKDMNAGWKYIRQMHGDLYGVGWDRAQDKADAAIAKVQS